MFAGLLPSLSVFSLNNRTLVFPAGVLITGVFLITGLFFLDRLKTVEYSMIQR